MDPSTTGSPAGPPCWPPCGCGRFHQRLPRVVEDRPDAEGVALASGWIVDWCRDNAEEAAVLHAPISVVSRYPARGTVPPASAADLARRVARLVRSG